MEKNTSPSTEELFQKLLASHTFLPSPIKNIPPIQIPVTNRLIYFAENGKIVILNATTLSTIAINQTNLNCFKDKTQVSNFQITYNKQGTKLAILYFDKNSNPEFLTYELLTDTFKPFPIIKTQLLGKSALHDFPKDTTDEFQTLSLINVQMNRVTPFGNKIYFLCYKPTVKLFGCTHPALERKQLEGAATCISLDLNS